MNAPLVGLGHPLPNRLVDLLIGSDEPTSFLLSRWILLARLGLFILRLRSGFDSSLRFPVRVDSRFHRKPCLRSSSSTYSFFLGNNGT